MKICPLAKRESWTHHIYACWAFLLYHETLYFHNCSLPPTSHLCYPIITHIHMSTAIVKGKSIGKVPIKFIAPFQGLRNG
jgi:hypothetical protein